MLTVAILIVFAAGVMMLLAISRSFHWIELTGFGLLFGLAMQTVFMFLLDVAGLTITSGSLLVFNAAFMAGCFWVVLRNRQEMIQEISAWRPKRLQDFDLTAIALFALVAWLFYAIAVKNLFWPPTEHDTLGSFDKLGRVIAAEGKLKISLYDYDLQGAGGYYPPLWHGMFAFGYLFGAEDPKIFTTLTYAGLLLTFFGIARLYAGNALAMLFTLALEMVPEMYSHAALSLGNLPTCAYVCAGALPLFAWLDGRGEKYFLTAAVGMAFALWIRSDTIAFAIAAGLIMTLYLFRTRDWKRFLVFNALMGSTFVMWNLYLKLKLGLSQTARFLSFAEVPDGRWEMMKEYLSIFLLGGAKGNVDGIQLYGISFTLSFLLVAIHLIYSAVRSRRQLLSQWPAAVMFLVSLAVFTLVYYLINEETQRTGMTVMMESSYKRGLFCFIPVLFFYALSNSTISAAAGWLEKWRNN